MNGTRVAGFLVLAFAGACAPTREIPVGASPEPAPRVAASAETAEVPNTEAPSAAPVHPPPPPLREVFPHVRVDAAAGIVEFDGSVPIDAHNAETPRVYLEVLACIPDTKEHEALVLTHARPSHVHAALLLCGLEPGTPGRWDWEGTLIRAIPPTGPRVRVTAAYEREGRTVEAPLSAWVVDARSGESLEALSGDAALVFAGSRMSRRGDMYQADGEGCLIGLSTFGGETVAWPNMFNPDSGVEEPRWIAGPATPPRGTAVRVRVRNE